MDSTDRGEQLICTRDDNRSFIRLGRAEKSAAAMMSTFALPPVTTQLPMLADRRWIVCKSVDVGDLFIALVQTRTTFVAEKR